MKRVFNKETAKVVGKVGLRIGKDIIREGTKQVIVKTVVATGVTFYFDKTEGVKNMTLDSILGDISRKEKRVARKMAKKAKREAKLDLDIEDLEKEKKILDDLKEELEKEAFKKRVFPDLHGSNDEIVK